jgi:hypothetical protein
VVTHSSSQMKMKFSIDSFFTAHLLHLFCSRERKRNSPDPREDKGNKKSVLPAKQERSLEWLQVDFIVSNRRLDQHERNRNKGRNFWISSWILLKSDHVSYRLRRDWESQETHRKQVNVSRIDTMSTEISVTFSICAKRVLLRIPNASSLNTSTSVLNHSYICLDTHRESHVTAWNFQSNKKFRYMHKRDTRDLNRSLHQILGGILAWLVTGSLLTNNKKSLEDKQGWVGKDFVESRIFHRSSSCQSRKGMSSKENRNLWG